MTFDGVGGASRETSRNLAFLNYGLLFAGFFFAGATALAAAVIAYLQLNAAPEPARSHFAFQLRTFWISFALALLGGFCLLGAVIYIAVSVYDVANVAGWGGFDQFEVVIGQVAFDGALLALLAGAVLLAFLSGLWLVGASAFGVLRLASDRGIGKSRGS